MMGDPKDNNPRSVYRYHKVNITRPFWLSKFKVTHGMWNAYQKVVLTKEDNALGGMKRVHCVRSEEIPAFCEWLTKRCRSSLPPKYVVRRPTEAEWEYALKANVTDPNDPYVRMYNAGIIYDIRDGVSYFAFPEVKDYVATWLHDAKPRLQSSGLWGVKEAEEVQEKAHIGRHSRIGAQILGMEVGTKSPNAWGLYDMVGNRGEIVEDMLDRSLVQMVNNSWNRRDQSAICYEPEETDPLHLAPRNSAKKGCLARGGFKNFGWMATASGKFDVGLSTQLPFRLCIGPDLMKEKGFKK